MRAVSLDTFQVRFPTFLGHYELTVTDGQAPTCWVQLAKTGQWKHASYGDISITTQDLSEMHHNFHHITPMAPTRLVVDYEHLSERPTLPEHGQASGWLLDVQLRENGAELWGLVEWTPDAADAIRQKKFQFISPTFQKKYVHKDGRKIGTTLRSAAITNHPFLEGMAAVTLTDRGGTSVALADQQDIPYDERARRVIEALCERYPGEYGSRADYMGMFEDRCLFRYEGKTFRSPVTFASDLSVTLGDPIEVLLQDVPLTAREELDMKTVKLTLPNGQVVEVPEQTLLDAEPVRQLRDRNTSAEQTAVVTALQQEVVSLRETTAAATARAEKIDLQLREQRIDAKLADMKRKGLISKPTGDSLRALALKDEEQFIALASTFTMPVVRLNVEEGSGEDTNATAADLFEQEVEQYADDKKVSLTDALRTVGAKNQAGARAYQLREGSNVKDTDADDPDED